MPRPTYARRVPRRPRAQDPNALSHITSRGNRGEPLFLDLTDGRRFLDTLDQTTERFRWQCLVYCLMTNHYHLIVRTPEPCLSQALHHLNGTYARWFNRRHGHQGHLFQRRFHSAAIESDWHLLEACRYVVLNPVRAGLVASPSDWMWSSYRATVGLSNGEAHVSVDEVLRFFGRNGTRRARHFGRSSRTLRACVPSEHGQVPGTWARPF